MRSRVLLFVIMAVAMAGCGSSSAAPTATPAPTTPAPTSTSAPRPTPTYTVSKGYLALVNSLCRALAGKNSKVVQADLPYYQYNSGLRWGLMGDGLGHTDDPALLNSWLSGGSPHCAAYTPDAAGHGTLLATGWGTPGPSALIELDVYPGKHWKINDFTFGSRVALRNAMQTAGPAIPYSG